MNNNILAIFTIATDNLPGLIEHLFLRPTRNGAVIVFKDVDEARAKELMESLPLYQFVQTVEYFPLMKQF